MVLIRGPMFMAAQSKPLIFNHKHPLKNKLAYFLEKEDVLFKKRRRSFRKKKANFSHAPASLKSISI